MKKIFASFALLSATVAVLAAPTTPAPVPSWPADQVMAVYSDSYEQKANWGYLESWGQSTILQAGEIQGNHYLAYSSFNYLGWQCASSYNCMTMEKLHLDIWADAAGKLNVYPIFGGAGLTTDDTKSKTVNLEAGKWNSFDLDLAADFAGLDLSSIFQFKFADGTISEFAIDNVFFYRTTALVDDEAPKNLSAELVSTNYFSASIKASATDNNGVVNFEVLQGEQVVATGAAASGVDAIVTVANLEPGKSYSFNVVAKDAVGNATAAVAVSATTPVLPAACPAPTAKAQNVKSLYSDVYEPATSLNNSNEGWWMPAHVTEAVMADGDKALFYYGINDPKSIYGWAFNSLDAAGFQKLHISVYPLGAGKFEIYPVIQPEDGFHLETAVLKPNEWNDVVLDYSDKTFAPFTQLGWIAYLELQSYFIDNVFFFNGDETAVEQVTSDVKAQKVLRDGQIYIIRNGEAYNLQGAQVR